MIVAENQPGSITRMLKEGTDLRKEITENLKGMLKPRQKKDEDTTPQRFDYYVDILSLYNCVT